jgi:hypothetical protein
MSENPYRPSMDEFKDYREQNELSVQATNRHFQKNALLRATAAADSMEDLRKILICLIEQAFSPNSVDVFEVLNPTDENVLSKL